MTRRRRISRKDIPWFERDKPKYRPRVQERKTCYDCGERNLNWVNKGGKWDLYYKGQLHVCKKKKVSFRNLKGK